MVPSVTSSLGGNNGLSSGGRSSASTAGSSGPFGPVDNPFGLLRFPFPQPFCLPRPPSTTSHDFRAVEQLVNANSGSNNNSSGGVSNASLNNRLAELQHLQHPLTHPFLVPPHSSSSNNISNSSSAIANLSSPSCPSPNVSATLSNLLLDHHNNHLQHHLHHHSNSASTNSAANQLQHHPLLNPCSNNSASSPVAELAANLHHHHPGLFLHSDFRPSPGGALGLPNLPFDPRTALDLAAAAAAAAANRHANSGAASGLTEPLDFYSQRLRQLAGGSSVSPSPGSPGFSRKPAMTPPSPLSPEDGKRFIVFINM